MFLDWRQCALLPVIIVVNESIYKLKHGNRYWKVLLHQCVFVTSMVSIWWLLLVRIAVSTILKSICHPFHVLIFLIIMSYNQFICLMEDLGPTPKTNFKEIIHGIFNATWDYQFYLGTSEIAWNSSRKSLRSKLLIKQFAIMCMVMSLQLSFLEHPRSLYAFSFKSYPIIWAGWHTSAFSILRDLESPKVRPACII